MDARRREGSGTFHEALKGRPAFSRLRGSLSTWSALAAGKGAPGLESGCGSGPAQPLPGWESSNGAPGLSFPSWGMWKVPQSQTLAWWLSAMTAFRITCVVFKDFRVRIPPQTKTKSVSGVAGQGWVLTKLCRQFQGAAGSKPHPNAASQLPCRTKARKPESGTLRHSFSNWSAPVCRWSESWVDFLRNGFPFFSP